MQIQKPTALQRRVKYSFRAFYLTALCISLLAVLSVVADQAARFRHGAHYGVAQKRALEQLDRNRLVKRDEEVRPYCKGVLRVLLIYDTNSAVLFIMQTINAPLSKPTVQTKKLVFFRICHYITAT